MRRGGSRLGSLLLFVLSGIIIGSIAGHILASFFDHDIFTFSYALGTQSTPAFIDLIIFRVAFGFTLYINFGTVLGLILGLFLYFKS
jgi:ABC-type dipeptide/oligopeptide/nickel transport system permease component